MEIVGGFIGIKLDMQWVMMEKTNRGGILVEGIRGGRNGGGWAMAVEMEPEKGVGS